LSKPNYVPSNFSKYTNFHHIVSFFKSIVDYTCHYFSALDIVVKSLKFYNRSKLIINFSYIIFNKYSLFKGLLNRTIYNYYINDGFSTNSKIMITCAAKMQFLNFSPIRSGYKSKF